MFMVLAWGLAAVLAGAQTEGPIEIVPSSYSGPGGQQGTYFYLDDVCGQTLPDETIECSVGPEQPHAGDLTDGYVESNSWRDYPPDTIPAGPEVKGPTDPGPYVAWKEQSPTITFGFGETSVDLGLIEVHLDDSMVDEEEDNGGVRPPRSIEVTMGGETLWQQVPNPPGTAPFTVSIDVSSLPADSEVAVTFNQRTLTEGNDWIFVSEVDFYKDESDGLTTDLLPWESDGYRYEIVPSEGGVAAGWETIGFDPDSAEWSTGAAGFGTVTTCPLAATTPWPLNSDLFVRHGVTIPAGASGVRVQVAVDNDIESIYFNGVLIRDFVGHEGCAARGDTGTFIVPTDVWNAGTENVVAVQATDRGGQSYLDVSVIAEVPASIDVERAIAGGTAAGVIGGLSPIPPGTELIEFITSNTCEEGEIGGDIVSLGTVEVSAENLTETGGFAAFVDEGVPVQDYIAARYVGAESNCVFADPVNDIWPRAKEISLSGGTIKTGDAVGFVDGPSVARWYKFNIQPGARAEITLNDLPADYDLFVFRDIQQVYDSLLALDGTEDLNLLSAEFAPSAFSPSAFSPSAFSPSAFSPSAFSPSAFSPSAFSPNVFAPSAFSPSAFSPSAFSPSAFSPSAFSPSAFSPSAFSPSAFSPSAFSPSAFSPSAFSPSAFSPEAFSSATIRSLIGVSAASGTGTERVIADTWNETGEFYIAIAGKNGAFDQDDSFAISVEMDGDTCDGVNPIGSAPGAQAAAGHETVILWDSSKIEGSPSEISALATKLTTLAGRSDVNGVVVDLQTNTRVQDLHAQADANSSCVYAENLVARSIKDVVDSYRANNSLQYVVLIGGDDSIPFFRYAESALLGPEEQYDPPVSGASNAALRLNYILGQDEYGSRFTIKRSDGDIPLPDLAVGRVVETAAEANTMLDAYLGESTVVPGSSLVTGYDFLTDASIDVLENLNAGIGTTPPTDVSANGCRTPGCLIDPGNRSPADPQSWTADDLASRLFANPYDVIFLAGHFSANSTLAADYETTLLTTDLATSPVDMTNTIVFSAGCHSGYNIVTTDQVTGVTLTLDWAQAFAQKGATLIAGTGYQYGDTDFIEYSERLYADFARELRTGTGAVSLGEALVDAKQNYLATTPDMRGLHRKSLIISTVFGLPMMSVDMPGARLPDGPVGPETLSLQNYPGGSPGGELGTQYADLTTAEALTTNTKTLSVLDETSGPTSYTATYLSGPNGVLTNPAEPAVPLISKNVSQSNKVLRGVGFLGGSYTDQLNILPLTGAPATELRGVHIPFASEVFYPMRLATPNYFGELGSGLGTRLHITPAQHRVDEVGDITGTLRKYSSMQFRLFYSGNTAAGGGGVPALSAPPSISDVEAQVNGSDVDVRVRAVADTLVNVQEVWVTYTDGRGTWQSLFLTRDSVDPTLWTGTIAGAASGSLDFMVQAVSGAGLLTISDNFGEYYHVAAPPAPAPTPTSLTVSGPGSAIFGDVVSASATLTGGDVAGKRILFRVGDTVRIGTTDSAGVATADLPLNVTPPGSYQLRASFAGNANQAPSNASTTLSIAKAGTTLTVVSGPNPVFEPGVPTSITATLATSNTNTLLPERTVYFTVDGTNGTQTIAKITNNNGVASLGPVDLPGGSYTVTAQYLGTVPNVGTLTNRTYGPSSGTTSIVLTTTIGAIDLVPAVTPVNVPVGASASYQSARTVNGTWEWGDDSSSAAVMSTSSGGGVASGSHQYTTPGVYTVTLTLTDDDGEYEQKYQFVVAYDPSGGFVTGGGWIDSPAGAYTPDPDLTGKASFGFVAKYKKGSNVPDGNTQFKFKAADFEFKSVSYEWLVIAGKRAQYKGEGTINGVGNYKFFLVGIDGDQPGGGGIDKFRVRIWDPSTDEVIYDNKIDASEDSEDATELGGGSIQIKKK